MSDDMVPNEPGRGAEHDAQLPAIIDGENSEIVISPQPEGLIVGGDADAVKAYLTQIRDTAARAVQISGIDKASLGNAAGLLAGAAAFFGQSGTFVQLHPNSYRAIKAGNLVPGTDGFFRMMTRGADNKFLQQLQWRPVAVNPAQLVGVQMIAVQIALKTAIVDVEKAVRRVEGKVDQVLKLAQADRAGNVLGNYTTVSHLADYLNQHGSLPEALWESVATLGPALTSTVEQLRNHIQRTLAGFNADDPVHDRVEALENAVTEGLLSEALSLLVVTEESLYLWQQLLLARVEATEPKHLSQVIEHSRQLLTQQRDADEALYHHAIEVLKHVGTAKNIDGFRFFAVRDLAKYRKQLRRDLDDFARARHHQVRGWKALATPTIGDAVDAAVEIAQQTAGRALAAAGEGLVRFGGRLAEQVPEDRAKPVDQPAGAEDAGS